MRDQGCGYNFEIDLLGKKAFVEVKGLADNEGGVAFTNKEWLFAKQVIEAYFLVLIRNLKDNPEVISIQNPTGVLSPIQHIYPKIQIQWKVLYKQINDLKQWFTVTHHQHLQKDFDFIPFLLKVPLIGQKEGLVQIIFSLLVILFIHLNITKVN